MKQQNFNSNTKHHKKIYFVWNYLEWGGVQIYFLGLMRSVSEKYQVKVVLPKESGGKILEYLKANNIEYEFYDGKIEFSSGGGVWAKLKRRWDYFRANWRLARHLSKYDLKDSIIQIDVAPWSGFSLLMYLTLKTNVFVTFHTAIPKQSFLRQILLRVKFGSLTAFSRFHVVASNLDVKKSLRPLISALRYGRIEIVYSSINIEEIEKAIKGGGTRQEMAGKYKFPAEKKWICNVAQFIERKGCWVFLETVKILQKERDDLFFFWLGTAPLSAATIENIEQYKLGNGFRYLSAEKIGGSRNDLLTIWKAADLFFLPSFQEGLPVALVEAMALGKTCIASDVNAIPEAIKHFETGILVTAGDSEKFAAAISELAGNASLRNKIGENAQRLVLENFEEKVIGRKMLKLYESVN